MPTKEKILYIAGPMANDPDHRQKFLNAEHIQRDYGKWDEIYNPIRTADILSAKPNGKAEYRECLLSDLALVGASTAIYMLKGWEQSNGAKAEHALAVALNLDIFYQN